mmetsp:Transcript_833/g.1405  ORF Transcript_833/g.1405 Transcript_833/m.1405 type:complete len:339 (-) Transcript_833:228-1244(-)|eukprot:CAMPEP_0185019752 /NCGR_PEP_ID=MMETSP1103-20130426/2345_1 /TAXON_ID=36769 /ORGANISM="Paraphysomonas bandaiensis, Strain Caron Lab Isolate" /LENGTH=338 /DNA_ID=CAMNT_0027550223 /DNA_START=70 /DNA_END=1086 /DNA_ORIENTATION=-
MIVQTQGPRKRKKSTEHPVFLKKTFNMLNSCDPKLARWTQAGTSFIVIDHVEFAERVIPQFFKHNNFSSFVRQLNFYGFHKVKSETKPNLSDEEAKVLEFHHPLFQRDRPDLLGEIKRSISCSESGPSAQEFEALKTEVSELTNQVERLAYAMSEIKDMLKRNLVESAPVDSSRPSKALKASRWDTLDDETIEMLLEIDNAGDSSSSTPYVAPLGRMSSRGAPYSHDVYKTATSPSNWRETEGKSAPASAAAARSNNSANSTLPSNAIPLPQATAALGLFFANCHETFSAIAGTVSGRRPYGIYAPQQQHSRQERVKNSDSTLATAFGLLRQDSTGSK